MKALSTLPTAVMRSLALSVTNLMAFVFASGSIKSRNYKQSREGTYIILHIKYTHTYTIYMQYINRGKKVYYIKII